jgi:hypothetical protein
MTQAPLRPTHYPESAIRPTLRTRHPHGAVRYFPVSGAIAVSCKVMQNRLVPGVDQAKRPLDEPHQFVRPIQFGQVPPAPAPAKTTPSHGTAPPPQARWERPERTLRPTPPDRPDPPPAAARQSPAPAPARPQSRQCARTHTPPAHSRSPPQTSGDAGSSVRTHRHSSTAPIPKSTSGTSTAMNVSRALV